jgi:hypothetical protein
VYHRQAGPTEEHRRLQPLDRGKHLGGDLPSLYRAKMRAAAPGVYKNVRHRRRAAESFLSLLSRPYLKPPETPALVSVRPHCFRSPQALMRSPGAPPSLPLFPRQRNQPGML